MGPVELAKLQSELAFEQLIRTLEGVDENVAWGILQPSGDDYLNTDGSIQGIVLHVASCKVMYGSIAFRNCEIRWRDCAERLDTFEPSWSAALDYLAEAHRYWRSTWEHLKDEDLEREALHFSGKMWPVWKIVHVVTDHDAYHAGQIAAVRFAASASTAPPPSSAADIRQYCSTLPSW